jgi:hypothetical protein
MSDQTPTQPNQGDPGTTQGWETPPQPAQPGWIPPPPPATPPSWDPPPGAPIRQPPARKSKAWVTWLIAVAAFGGGLIVGSAGTDSGDSSQTARTVTVTSRIEVTRHVFTTFCQDLESETERKACEAVKDIHEQELREARAAGKAAATPTTKPKPTPAPAPTFGDGLYKVGADIQPGSYRTAGGTECYYARLRSDDTSSIIANNLTSGPQRMTVRSSDGYVEFSGGCEWTKAG